MSRDIHLQPAYLLHSRPFRDTSLLLDFITRDHGRLSAIARGARKAGSRNRGLLQPFTPLQASFAGRHELKTLRQVEALSGAFPLRGQALFSALYVNELMTRLIHGDEAEAGLFDIYEQALAQLAGAGGEVEPPLRRFELALLEALGYGIPFDTDAETGAPLEAGESYHFRPEEGFSRMMPGVRDAARSQRDAGAQPFSGRDILAIGERDFSDPAVRKAAKRLMRQVLSVYLGDKPLKSRRLFTGQ